MHHRSLSWTFVARSVVFVVGLVFFMGWIVLSWHDPAVFRWGADGEDVKPEGPLQLWLARYVYIHTLLVALYRWWAESRADDFPPYNPFVMLVVWLVPALGISAWIRYT